MKSLSRNQIIGVIVALVVVGYFLGQHLYFTARSNDSLDSVAALGDDAVMENQVIMDDISAGSGTEAMTGKLLTVHYVGTLPDGTVFDSSRARNQPFQFVVGGGKVIRGWDEGLIGMKVGGTRRLTIPPELGYGVRGVEDQNNPGTFIIPPNTTLTFEVELLNVE